MARWPSKKMRRMISITMFAIMVAAIIVNKLPHGPGLFGPDQNSRHLAGPMPIGVDVSHHQGAIDWDKLAADRVSFAYIKATEGGDWLDTRFAENWRAAKRTSIARGAYHYFTLCTPAETQAAHFIRTLGPLDNDLPPALDVEQMEPCSDESTQQTPAEGVDIFLDIVEAHYGVRPIIYTTRDFHDAHLQSMTGERFWVSSISNEPDWRTEDWVIWQFTHRGTRAGINGAVDMNRLKGEMETLGAMRVSGPE